MKYWRNHYGRSQIFGKARFEVDPAADVGDVTEDNDLGGTGGSSTPTIDELQDQLAKALAERDTALNKERKTKLSLDKVMKENGELKSEKRSKMSAEEQADAEKIELQNRIAELEAQARVNAYSKKFMGVGMTEADATKFAGILPAFKDDDAAEDFFNDLGKFIEAAKKSAGDEAIQRLLKDRPDIQAGNDGANVKASVERAKTLAAAKNAAVNTDTIKKYSVGGR